MNNNIDFIKETTSNYELEYGVKIPPIDITPEDIVNNDVAYFEGRELYNGIYNLHVDISKLMKSRDHGEVIIYHELTHLLDSQKLVDVSNSYEDFRNKILSYSEFHASEIEMAKRLEEIKESVNRYSRIQYDGRKISIDDFMSKTTKFVAEAFDNLNFNSGFGSQIVRLFYLLGYTSALKKVNFQYNPDFRKINPLYRQHCKNLKQLLLTDDACDVDVIASEFMDMFNIFVTTK